MGIKRITKFLSNTNLLWPVGVFIPLVLCGCVYHDKAQQNTLQELVYEAGKEESTYTVMIDEGESHAPYLVLTDNYNGMNNCLLIRKNLLETLHIYNENTRYSGYYAESEIDRYLNDEFLHSLPEYIRKCLVPTEIVITNRDCLRTGQAEIETICRSIFLLSYTEVGGRSSNVIAEEGTVLSYFDSNERRIAATTVTGKTSSWALRTPVVWYDNMVCGVNENGVIGIGGVGSFGDDGEYQNGVRPAFCISRELSIEYKDGAFYLIPSAI